jgi:ATP phosphoribosyltransferase
LNVVREKEARVAQLDLLGFGSCELAVAVHKNTSFQSVYDLSGRRIATSYPRILRNYLHERNIDDVRVIEITGSVEIAPALDVAEAICDLVSTGTTLRVHDLKPIEVVMRSEAVLVANPSALGDERKRRLMERLRARMVSHLRARRTKYVMMNAPGESIDRIKEILPGMKSPTILPLAKEGMVAVHTAVPEELFWDVAERLKSEGATDILVVPVEKMVE